MSCWRPCGYGCHLSAQSKPFALHLSVLAHEVAHVISEGDTEPKFVERQVKATAPFAHEPRGKLYLVAADVLLDVALGFGVGFLARKLFGWLFSGDNDIKRQPEKVIDKEALAQHMHRAAMQVEVLGKSYLALPAPVSA